MFNLTPITTRANAKHKNMVEKSVKQWVNVDHKVVYYQVTADYGGTRKKGARQLASKRKPR